MAAQPQGQIIYWFDACSFLELQRRYPRPTFDAIWTFISSLLTIRRIMSTEDVYIELGRQDDEIAAWLTEWKNNFVPLDTPIQGKVREILRQFPHLLDLKTGKSSADPFLLATAIVRRGIVVSEEKFSGGPDRVKIPDVARTLGVPCIKFLEFVQREGLRLA
jgi:hypothetical protein